MKRAVFCGLLLAATSACSDATGIDRIVEIEMLDNRFAPDTIRIDRGTAVRWVNHGAATHNARGPWWTVPSLAPGRSYEERMHHTGEYEYRCTLHEGMSGVIIVR